MFGNIFFRGIFGGFLSFISNIFGGGGCSKTFGGCQGGNCKRNSIFDFNKDMEDGYNDSFEYSDTDSDSDKDSALKIFTQKKTKNKSKISNSDKTSDNKGSFPKEHQKFLKLINDYRAKHGLRPLKLNKNLCKGTQAHAEWMSRNRSMTHANLRNVGKNGGYKGFVNTENIAAGQRNYKEAFTSWINSSGHRQNILNPNAKDLGFGFKNGYWSMNTGVS